VHGHYSGRTEKATKEGGHFFIERGGQITSMWCGDGANETDATSEKKGLKVTSNPKRGSEEKAFQNEKLMKNYLGNEGGDWKEERGAENLKSIGFSHALRNGKTDLRGNRGGKLNQYQLLYKAINSHSGGRFRRRSDAYF